MYVETRISNEPRLKKCQAVSTNYLVTSSTEILRSVHFWLQSIGGNPGGVGGGGGGDKTPLSEGCPP